MTGDRLSELAAGLRRSGLVYVVSPSGELRVMSLDEYRAGDGEGLCFLACGEALTAVARMKARS